jgi:hypothetical protein
LENITTLVLAAFTFNFQVSQYKYIAIRADWNSAAVSANITHAYNGLDDVCNISHLLFDNDDIEVYFKLYLLLYADDSYICWNCGWISVSS